MFKSLSSAARLAGAAAVLLVVIAGLTWLALRGAPRPLTGGGVPGTETLAPVSTSTPTAALEEDGPTPTAPDSQEGRIDLAEAERLVREFVFASQPGMNPAEKFPLQELTTDESWQRMRAQVFMVSEGAQQFQSYAVIDGQVYPIGESFGGMGVHTLLVSDLNADSAPELVYAYSFGSGIHQSSIGILQPVEGGYGTFAIIDFRYRGELRLEKQDDQTVRVTGIPDSGGEQALGRLMLLDTQLVIAPGDAALVAFSSQEYGVSFLIPETWQADPGAHFSITSLELDEQEGNLARTCEWEANRDGAQPRIQTASLGERESCVVMPDASVGEPDWSIFYASGGKINRLTVEAAYAQVVAQSFRYLEPLPTLAPQVMDMTPRAPGTGEVETRALGSLTLSEYPVVKAAEDTPSHFEYNARIPDTVFPDRSTWYNDSMEETIARANAQLKPFGYQVVERKDASNNRVDLYRNGELFRGGLSMFYPPSVYFVGNGAGDTSASDFAMVIEDDNYKAWLVRKDSIEPFDLMNSRNTRPVLAGPRLVSARRGGSNDGGDRVEVLADGEVIFTYVLAPSPVVEAVKTLDEWQGGWVLEIGGTLIVNGANWNQKELRADEIFNWTKIDGRPFFFYRREGKLHAWYDGQELPMGYDEIVHYRCCEPAAFNVLNNPDALWFHAKKDTIWYYVEIKK